MSPGSRILRTFVALPIEAGIRAALAEEGRRLQRLERSLRLVREENLHVTVAFLGPTVEDDVPRVAEVLTGAAAAFPRIPVRYAGLGAFPDAHRPRVVWAGVVEAEGEGVIADLASRVARGLVALGYAIDAERFHPHVTLGRLETRSVSGLLKKELATDLPPCTLQTTYGSETLSDLTLMLSEHGSGGTRYRPLVVVPLGSPSGPQGAGAGSRPPLPPG